MKGTVGGVARSFEITKRAGSNPCAIMACSTSGSLRLNSAENPPTVDCSMIDTASPQRTPRYLRRGEEAGGSSAVIARLSRGKTTPDGQKRLRQQKSRRCRRLLSLDPPKSMRGFQGGLFLPRNRAFHRRLHLLEGADLDLPHAFARHTEFGGEIFQRHRVFRQPPRLEDAAFPGVEHAARAVQRLAAMIELLVLGHDGFLVGRSVDQPVLPFAGLAVVADRRVERGIAAEPAVHV